MFQPDSDIQRSSTLTAFLKDCGIDSYKDLARRANEEPDWFWGRIIDHVGIRFARPYTRMRDISEGSESIKWAVGGTLNLTETCLDARIAQGHGEKIAIDWVGEDGSRRRWTYFELAAEAFRVASALAAREVRPGQAVGVNMPMIPEIEAALTESGEVVDATAIAAPDAIKGAAVVCICVAAPDVSPDADLVDRFKGRVGEIVSKPFRPRDIHFVEALPKTRSMKTMRRIMRTAFLGEYPGDLWSISNPETIQPIADLQKEKP